MGVPLPFKCRCLQDAAQADVNISKLGEPENGKYEVLFPIGMPDEGTFQWLEGFLEKHPQYVELSDRKIVEWAERSGLTRQRSYLGHSNDRPDAAFGMPSLDDFTIRKIIRTVASVVPRHYVVMEVRGNLLKSEREALRRCFAAPYFKPVACVIMGEPDEEYKTKVRAALLAEKQQKVENEWRVQQAERERKRILEQRQKEVLARAKATDEASAGEVKDDDGKQETKEEEVKEEDVKKEEVEEDKGPPQAELSEEELKIHFKPQAIPDLTEQVLAESFASFSLPEESDGFAEIRYAWEDQAACKNYVRKWILAKKLTTRVEDLQPSEWFFTKLSDWQKILQEWQLTQKEFRQDPMRREAAKVRAQKEKGKKDKEEKRREEGIEACEEERLEIEKQDDLAPVDIFTVKDVCDIGDGEPLFANFMFEDWALMSLRFELFLLVRAFKADVNDPDRPGMPEDHLPFYYNKYYAKALNTRFFGTSTTSELVAMVKDTVHIAEDSLLCAQLPDDQEPVSDIFVKLTEESRRDRHHRIDAGDETAKLRFSVLASPPPQQVPGEKGGPRVISSPLSRNFQSGWGQQPPQQPPQQLPQRPSQRSNWGSWTQQGLGYAPKQQA